MRSTSEATEESVPAFEEWINSLDPEELGGAILIALLAM